MNTATFECKNVCSCEKNGVAFTRDIYEFFLHSNSQVVKSNGIKVQKKHENKNRNEIPQNRYDENNFQPKKEQSKGKIEDTDKPNKKTVK